MGVDGIRVAGYRSLGREPEELSDLGKVNVIIGKNNSGKSNIISFLYRLPRLLATPVHHDLPATNDQSKKEFDALYDLNRTDNVQQIKFQIQAKPDSSYSGNLYQALSNILPDIPQKFPQWNGTFWLPYVVTKLERGVAEIDKELLKRTLRAAYSDPETDVITARHCNYRGGAPEKRIEDIAGKLDLRGHFSLKVQVIPAYRKVTADETSWELSGAGLVRKLNQLEHPKIGYEQDRERFELINTFVRDILGERSARLEIPYTLDQIYVEMDGKRLPLDNLGTGVHQVIILAAAVTLFEKTLVCIEEPEIYLHPDLQKKFMNYIAQKTDNQYLVTTHSNAVFDCGDLNIYHCRMEQEKSRFTLVSSTLDKWTILDELGCRASDIIQTNCIVWVEGPSDRIYINKWIREVAPELREGLNYSIMFYGGRLLSHLTADEQEVSEFIKLGRLNRNTAIVMDSDKLARQTSLNATKKRVREEIQKNRGFCWVTAGREIENYVHKEVMHKVIRQCYPKCLPASWGQYEKVTTYQLDGEEKDIDKVRVAKTVDALPTDLSVLDLSKQVQSLVSFIKRSNQVPT